MFQKTGFGLLPLDLGPNPGFGTGNPGFSIEIQGPGRFWGTFPKKSGPDPGFGPESRIWRPVRFFLESPIFAQSWPHLLKGGRKPPYQGF